MDRNVKTERISYKRALKIPNKLEIARCRKAPEYGPRILFFSGGTALKRVSQHIIDYSHNTIHIITPFDSGGSSAKLRDAFHMLSVGDVRNRIMALADTSIKGNPQVYRLFGYRFPKDGDNAALRKELDVMIDERHDKLENIPEPLRNIIQVHLGFFRKKMPEDFDLRGASIGNLILTGGYLNNDRDIDSVIFLFSKLVEARATVRPVSEEFRQICAELEDGRLLIGQDLWTGKETEPLDMKIKDIYLTNNRNDSSRSDVKLEKKISKLISKADLICYPMGSFYSSVVSNFLISGVGQSIAENPCLKVFIPNSYEDPEQCGMSLLESVEKLIHYLKQSCDSEVDEKDLLNLVIIDPENGNYPDLEGLKEIEKKGIKVIEADLIAEKPVIDEKKLTDVLLSLI